MRVELGSSRLVKRVALTVVGAVIAAGMLFVSPAGAVTSTGQAGCLIGQVAYSYAAPSGCGPNFYNVEYTSQWVQNYADSGSLPPGIMRIAATYGPGSYAGRFQGTYTTAGRYIWNFNYRENSGDRTRQYIFKIWDGPPVFTSGQSTTGTVGVNLPLETGYPVTSPAGYALPFSQFPNSFTYSGLPPGMSLNADYGVIYGTPTQAGTFTVSITGSNSFGSASGTFDITIASGTQTLTFANPGTKAMSSTPYVLTATASSRLAPTFTSSTPLTCSVDGLNLTTISTGLCTIKASQAGSASYAAAADVTQSFSITKGTQAALTVSSTAALYGAGLALVTVGGSGTGAVTYAVTTVGSANCSLVSPSSTSLIFTSVGTCAVTATKGGDASYNAISSSATTITISANPARTPTFSAVTRTLGGFATSITNFDAAFTWSASVPGGSASINSATGLLTVTGLATGTSVTATVTTTRTGYSNGSALIDGTSIAAPLISSATTTSGTVGSVLATYTIGATNSPSSFSATGLPAGLGVDPSTGQITGIPSTAGTFSVGISATNAAATGSATLTITIAKATPVVTWITPASLVYGTALSATQLNAIAAVGGTSIPGAFTYSTSLGTILPVGSNSMRVDFAPTDTTNYNAALPVAVSQVVTLAPQVITWVPIRNVLSNASPLSFAAASTSGSGAVTYSVTTPSTAGCVIALGTAPTMSFATAGTCSVTATAAATATHAVSTSVKVFTITDPPVVIGGGGGTPGPESSAIGTSIGALTTSFVSENAGAPGSASAPAGDGTKPVTGIGLPPAPIGVRILPNSSARTARVIAKLPSRSSGAEVVSTVVEVRDKSGKLVARVVVAVKSHETEVSVTVPYAADGYSVNVYNVNSVGVSEGADTSSGLVHASTITSRTASGTPALFGTQIITPVYFTAASATLDATDKKALDVATARVANTTKRLFITGFARLGGGAKKELAAISTARAKNVATYLAGKGIRVWIRYYGVGALKGTGQWQDRRVEIRASDLAIPRSMAR